MGDGAAAMVTIPLVYRGQALHLAYDPARLADEEGAGLVARWEHVHNEQRFGISREVLLRALVSWDYRGTDGMPLPITVDAVEHRWPSLLVLVCGEAIVEHHLRAIRHPVDLQERRRRRGEDK